MMFLRVCRRPLQRFLILSFFFTILMFVYFMGFYVKETIVAESKREPVYTGTGTIRNGLAGWFTWDDPKFKMQKGQACVHPKLELWHPELSKYFKDVPPLKCADAENWVYIDNGTFRIAPSAIRSHGKVTCDYAPYVRGNNDFTVTEGEHIKNIKDNSPLTSDFFLVKCSSEDGSVYKNIHSGIAYNPSLHERSPKVTIPKESMGLNVLMFGFDSTSRMTWMRNLPKSHMYFVQQMGAIVLEGYNIVGDGTPQALLPILTGKTEPELPEARRGHHGATTVDGHPWVWKDFKNQGYVTQWGEDGSGFGTFTYRMLGFKNQPVDHYLRTFYIQAEKLYGINRPFCLGSLPRHLNMLNWGRDFYMMYKDKPKFSFLFHSEFTHGGYSEVRVVDDDLLNFLKYMNDNGYLNNTLLILMADHGARFQAVRQTVQGKYEERMPYFAFRFPPWFEKKYPDAILNFKKNTHRLTTPFDIHETFMDIMNYTGAGKGNVKSRGISLFKEVPLERTCSDAGIEPHWCACLDWQPVSLKDSIIRRAAQKLLDSINAITASEKDKCARLHLGNITAAVQHAPNDKLLKFKQSADHDGRLPDLSDDMSNYEVFYQVSITSSPGNAQFEATIKYVVKSDTFSVSEREISRINKYGNQPHCVMEKFPHLRPYCYCKEQLKP